MFCMIFFWGRTSDVFPTEQLIFLESRNLVYNISPLPSLQKMFLKPRSVSVYLAQFSNDLILGVSMPCMLSSALNLCSQSRIGITFSSSKRGYLKLERNTACALFFSTSNKQKRNSGILWNSHRHTVFPP